MSSYGSSTGVTAPYLDEKKALENVLYVLQHVDKGELEELLRNEDQLNDIITDNEEVKKFKVQRETLMASNKNLAVLNLSMEPMMASKKQLLIESHQNRTMIQEEFAKNRQKLAIIKVFLKRFVLNLKILKDQLRLSEWAERLRADSVSKEYSADTTLALLQAATAQAEEEAEKLLDMFLDKQMNVEDFIEEFQKKKTVHHLRRIKSEKLSEILQKRTPSQYSYRF